MALRSRLIMDPTEVLRIIDSMNDSDRCSGEDNGASYDDIIDFYTCQWCLSKMTNNVLITFIVCHFV